MGLRGPAPKPTAIKKIEGNPGRRKLNANEPLIDPSIPQCPEYLDAVAKREWNRIAAILLTMRVLTDADYIALANLCQTLSTLEAARKQMSKSGILFKTPGGYVQQSPLFSIVSNLEKSVNRWLREFGMTPSSRTRITVAPPPEKKTNKFARLSEDIDPLGPSTSVQ